MTKTDKFDVVADADGNDRLTQPVARKMMQQLLADRFHLASHSGLKELSVYEIVSANEKPKLTKSPGDVNGFGTVGFPTLGEMKVNNSTIAEFANFLQRYVLDRPVLDESGIEGRYEFKLDWTKPMRPSSSGARVKCSRPAALWSRRICSPPCINSSACGSCRRRNWLR